MLHVVLNQIGFSVHIFFRIEDDTQESRLRGDYHILEQKETEERDKIIEMEDDLKLKPD